MFSVLLRRGGQAPIMRRVAVVLFSALMFPAVLVSGSLTASQSIVLISIATFGYSGALANLLAIPGDAFPADVVASVWGFASMGSGVGAMLFSLITGWLVDHYSFRPTFALFGALPVISAWMVWTLPRQTRRASATLQSG